MARLNCTVERVAYPPATQKDANWFILVTDRGTAKGKMPWRPKDGDALVLDGEWTTYRGEKKFKFNSAMIDIPESPKDQLHYVVTRTIGLGPAMESIIWDRAGEAWKDIGPDEVPKLKGRVYEEFRNQIKLLDQDRDKVQAIAFLMGKRCSQNMACAAWERWERETLGVVNNNPYQLAELHGYGFKHVDTEIRVKFGIGDSDPRRVKAAVVYSLRMLTDSGSTVVEWREIMTKCMGYLGGMASLIVECTREMFADGTLYAFPEIQSVSLRSDYDDERVIWDFVTGEKQEGGIE